MTTRNCRLTPLWGWFLWMIIVLCVINAAFDLSHNLWSDAIGRIDMAFMCFLIWLWQRQTKRIIKDIEDAVKKLMSIHTEGLSKTNKKRIRNAMLKLEAWL